MSTPNGFVTLPGSERLPVPGATSTGTRDLDERLEVTLLMRRKKPLPSLRDMVKQLPADRRYISRENFDLEYGAQSQDIDLVKAFAAKHHLQVVNVSTSRRSIILSGTVDAANKAFGVTLETYEHEGGSYRGRTGVIHIPENLKDIIVGVFGLDNRPFARPHFMLNRDYRAASGSTSSLKAVTFNPPELARLYNFPTGVDGTGETIGIIELGGGYRPADLKKYFSQLGLKEPKVTAVSVDHARNAPVGSPDSADGEVALDIEVAGSIAPGAHIAVYFAPATSDQNFLDVLTTAIHDTKHAPSIISISWGGPETASTPSFMQEFDSALQAAALLGVTVLSAAGDNGAADETGNQWNGKANVDFPSSSSWILACGGTSLAVSGSRISAETVWNQQSEDPSPDFSFGATGGGISQVFAVPDYQEHLTLPPSANRGDKPGRGVPDVAGNADPATGYNVLVDGEAIQVGGTSAVAPLWAGLLALINQSLGAKAGFINTLLYTQTSGATALNDITGGDNRVGSSKIGYDAASGWDACTGLGSPDGAAVLSLLQGKPKA